MLLSSPLSERLTLHARHVLKEARDIARYTKSTAIELRHLILALSLEEGSLGSILLDTLGFKKDALGKYCLKKTPARKTGKLPRLKTELDLPLGEATQEVMKRAFFIASEHHYPYVGTEHLIGALFESSDPFLIELIQNLAIDQDKIDNLIESHLHFEQFPQMARMFEAPELAGISNASGSATPYLDQYAIDVALLNQTNPVSMVGREAELDRLIQILGRKEKRNALLLGDPGVGKTALVTALAQKIADHTAGPLLRGKRIYALDLTTLVAGTSFRGEFEARLKELLKEVKQHGKVILFIDEIHTIIGTGNTQGGLDAANILKPSLARGDIQLIGATTLGEYKRHLEKDSAFDRRFQTILLREPTPVESLAILRSARPSYEAHHQVTIPDSLLELAVDLSVRYIHDRFLPDKALDLIDETGALVRRRSDRATPNSLPTLQVLETKLADLYQEKTHLLKASRYEEALTLQKRLRTLEQDLAQKHTPLSGSTQAHTAEHTATETDLLTVLSHMTHIPLERLQANNPAQELKHIRKFLHERFIGQDEVRASVLKLLTRSLSHINDPERPLGSFLLLGPTGVGKTHLAKLLAEALFGDAEALIRLDMSEFMERHSAAQILGAPAGYVGYGDGGKLTEAVRRRPYSIVLFDEIEKAHPDVHNLLLQILDEGHLTDAEGRRVSFKNTLILLTSNIGTASFDSIAQIGFHDTRSQTTRDQAFETTKRIVLSELRETLRPELLSRLDHTLVFRPLSTEALAQIAMLELETLKKRLKQNHVPLVIGKNVGKAIAATLLKEETGARLIRKYISEHIETLLAEKLLSIPRPTKLTLSARHGSLNVR